jgi:predicted Zn-ribbon and HTH transcriptional regulator
MSATFVRDQNNCSSIIATLGSRNELMPEADIIQLGFVKHLIECPHCQKQIVQNWPGNMILYSPAKCKECGKEFVIALNKPHS